MSDNTIQKDAFYQEALDFHSQGARKGKVAIDLPKPLNNQRVVMYSSMMDCRHHEPLSPLLQYY